MTEFEPAVAYLETLTKDVPAAPVVFYGSSSFTMWHSLADDLRSDRVVNRGFGGSTLAACVFYFDRLIAPLQPASLVLYAGDNDLAHGRRPSAILDSFEALLAKIEQAAPGIPLGVLGIKPSRARWTLMRRIRETNDGMQRCLRKRTGPSYFIDTIEPMLAADGRPDARLFLEDGLHLSRAGYALWAVLLEPYREGLLFGRRREGCIGGPVQQVL